MIKKIQNLYWWLNSPHRLTIEYFSLAAFVVLFTFIIFATILTLIGSCTNQATYCLLFLFLPAAKRLGQTVHSTYQHIRNARRHRQGEGQKP